MAHGHPCMNPRHQCMMGVALPTTAAIHHPTNREAGHQVEGEVPGIQQTPTPLPGKLSVPG